MKKLINLVVLVMLAVNVLTPVSYAQIELEKDPFDYDNQEVTLVVDANNPESNVVVLMDEWVSDYMLYSRRYVSDGIEFAEWYDNENLEGEPIDVINTPITGSVTLYAKWIQKIIYQPWSIKISNGDKTILIKDVNQGWNSNDVDKFQKIQKLTNDKNYCHNEDICVSDDRSCYMVFVCNEDFYTEATNILWIQVSKLDQIDEYFTGLYWRYYFRWNNWYAEYEELTFLQHWEIDVDMEAQTRWFLNYSKIENSDMWRKVNQKSQNPCDVTKWEYMPTLNDWAELMYMWADINWEDISVYNPNEEALRWGFSKGGEIDVNKHIKLLNPKLFQQDILIPNAWFIGSYQNKLNYSNQPALLWMAMDNERRYWSYNVKFGELSPNVSESEAYPVRCFLVENPVTVEFDTNEWSDIESYKVQEWTTITPPVNPTKDWYTFEWWYKTGLMEKWDFDRDVVEWEKVTLYAKWRVCGDWFTVNWNKCIPNWIIEVSNWSDVILIRDKNVWAGVACSSELLELLSMKICDPEPEAPIEKWVEEGIVLKGYVWSCMEESEFFQQVNAIVDDARISTKEEFDTYVEQKLRNCMWNYYFRWNNSGAWYNDFEFHDENMPNRITNTWVLLSDWFDGWKMWMLEWSGWIKWNLQNNPCNATWEYLPTTEDWERLMNVWMDKNGNNFLDFIVSEDFGAQTKWTFVKNSSNFSSPEVIQEFMRDMKIPSAWIVNYSHGCILGTQGEMEQSLSKGFVECEDGFSYDKESFGLRTAQKDWNIWIFDGSDASSNTVDDSIADWWNNVAAPVRCFVDVNMSEVLVVTLVSEWQIIKEVNVISGEKLWNISVDWRNWYSFKWRYTEEDVKYNFDSSVTGDITLYAKWTKNEWGGHSGWWGWSSSNKIDKSDTSVTEKNMDTVDITDTQWDTGLSPLVSQWDDERDSLSKHPVQIDDSANNGSTKWNKYTSDLLEAYNYAKKTGITAKSSIEKANMYWNLTRIQMAKMLSQYAINVMWREPDTSKWIVKFNDVTNKMDEQYDNGVTFAYQLGIMWINMPNNKFRPNDEVTRAEFAAALSRLLYSTSDGDYESTSKYYINHMEKLKSEKILTNTNPKMVERRWYVMVMLMRSAE